MPDIFAGQGKAGGVRLYTIGFTKTTAADFFGRLQSAGVQRIVDVRLNPDGQLSGFANRDDLAFFAERLCGIGYRHAPELAPTKPMFDEYKKLKGPWPDYEAKFLKLIAERHIETTETPADLDGGCLLCSEDVPHHCHRRLVAEYLKDRWGGVEIVHL